MYRDTQMRVPIFIFSRLTELTAYKIRYHY